MKNRLKNSLFFPVLCLLMVAGFSACSDWTETESLKVNAPNIGNQDPELYARYLEHLRAYKKSDHKIVYSWFDNSLKQTFSSGHHIVTVPDSVDIISLMSPDHLTDQEIEEMRTVQNDKGTKVIFTISYPEIERQYKAWLEEQEGNQETPAVVAEKGGNNEGESGEVPENGFTTYMTSYMDRALALVDKYGYDGLAIHYEGKSSNHMTEAEKAEYTALQQAFLAKVTGWYAGHKGKMLVFEGLPQNLVDKSILNDCKYIVLRTYTAASLYNLVYNVNMACVDGVPTDRFIVSVQPFSTDESDVKTGHFADTGDGNTSAILQAATWVASSEGENYTKAGLGIYNIQQDYFNTILIYQYTREAISMMSVAY